MDSILFDQEWQRVAVDQAPPPYDQLQDILDFVDKLDYVDSLASKRRVLTVAEEASIEIGRLMFQWRLWAIRNHEWKFRNENGEWEDA